jgi:glycosyltransferase 2 family protein
MSETEGVLIERSPADVVRVVVAGTALLAILLIEWLFGDTLVAFGTEVLRGLDALPQWIVDVVVVGTRLLAVVILGGGFLWVLFQQRWAMFARVVAAGLLAAVLVTLVNDLVEVNDGVAPVDVNIDVAVLDDAGFPSAVGVGVVAGVLTAAAPWLSRRWRRAGWALLVGLMAMRFVATPVSFDSLEAAIIGWLCGAGVLVVMGAPSRRPTRESVIAGLADVGLAVQQLDRAGVDARGSTPYFGVAAGGERLFVKALGEDERSADLLFRLYRRITPRDFGDEKPFSTLRRAVEHEAFVALAARDLGVRTPRLRAFTTADPNGYVVAYEAIEGKSLDRLDADEITDDVLTACWRLVGQLRRHRIAHRDLRLANIFLDECGDVWLIDFGFSEMAAADRLLATDVAELVASSSMPVGPERAVAHAAVSVDRTTLERALDRLHLWALSGATRAGLKARPGQLDELRDRLRDAVGRPAFGVQTRAQR